MGKFILYKNIQFKYGNTLLHKLLTSKDVTEVNYQCVKALIETGADLDIKDDDGVSIRDLGVNSDSKRIQELFN